MCQSCPGPVLGSVLKSLGSCSFHSFYPLNLHVRKLRLSMWKERPFRGRGSGGWINVIRTGAVGGRELIFSANSQHHGPTYATVYFWSSVWTKMPACSWMSKFSQCHMEWRRSNLTELCPNSWSADCEQSNSYHFMPPRCRILIDLVIHWKSVVLF